MKRIQQIPKRQAAGSKRCGFAVLLAMICLLLVSMVGMSLMKLAWAQHRQIQREQLRVQAVLLADSAVERAVARLSENTNYKGETWNLASEQLGGKRAGIVKISIDAVNGNPQQRSVSVVADFPANTEQRARIRRSILVDLDRGT